MSIKNLKTVKGRVIIKDGRVEVPRLPKYPLQGLSYWLNSPNGRSAYTHQLFRFPAKFHPPVVQWALGTYGRRGSSVLDPFTGSGTVQVEALIRGINSFGIDIDPLACLIAKAKTTPIPLNKLNDCYKRIRNILSSYLSSHYSQERTPGSDITLDSYEKESIHLKIPPLPNIFHWFRKYIVVDLARIKWAIEQTCFEHDVKQFFLSCFAAIIRRVSNADPAPVSGLEVTKIQREKNQNRAIKVFEIFFNKVEREIQQMNEMSDKLESNRISTGVKAHVLNGNIVELQELIFNIMPDHGFPLIITSPPYCRSVRYSRRHRLEMFWLDLVSDPVDHISLAHTYIGREYVRVNDWDSNKRFGIRALDSTLNRIDAVDHHKARAVHHYFKSMELAFDEIRKIISKSGTLVCVIGDSVCCGVPIATSDILVKISMNYFTLKNRFSYAIRNHHMQYGLWNGEGIKEEHVLVFKPI